MKTKTLLNSDKAWQLKPDDAIQPGDWVEYERGTVDPVALSDRACGLLVLQLNSVGFLGLFRARAFRCGMIKR